MGHPVYPQYKMKGRSINVMFTKGTGVVIVGDPPYKKGKDKALTDFVVNRICYFIQ